MAPIRSAANSKILEVRKLFTRRGRRRIGMTVVEGIRLSRELLEAGHPIRYLLLEEGRASQIAQQAARGGVPCHRVTSHLFRKIASTVHSQGVLAVVATKSRDVVSLLDELTGLSSPVRILVLDRIQDPGNLGTIVRTALAFGFSAGIACQGTTDPWGQKAVRGSAGAVFHLPLASGGKLDELAPLLAARGISLCTTASDAETPLERWTPPSRLALVISNEGEGVDAQAASGADIHVRIPISGRVESLNAAVAFAIIAHHLHAMDAGKIRKS